MKKPLIVAATIAALVAAGILGAVFWMGSADTSELVQAAIPPRPDLSNWPAPFQQRLDEMEARARSGKDAVRALGELSALYHANGFYAEAGQLYDALEYLDPENPAWPHRHAIILAGYGDAENALPRFETVIDLAPNHLPAHLRRADLLLKLNRLDDAAAAYRRVLELSPDNPYALLGLARCDFEQERWEAAREKLEKVVSLTNYQLGYDLIVTVYEKLGMKSRADAVRGQHKASGAYRDPPDPWIEILYDDCYDVYRLSMAAGEAMGQNKPELAIERLKRAIDLAPDNATLHFQLGTILISQGALTSARGHLERCTSLDPKFPDGWAHLVDLLARLGRSREADQTLTAGLAHCPTSPGLHLTKARRLQRAGDTENAIREFKESIRLRPNEADTYIELASYLIQLDRVEEGIAQLKAGLEAEPDNPAALATLAFYSITSGNRTEADQWLARAIAQPRVERDRISQLQAAYRRQFGESFR